ncbi:hypothetical protein D3C84_1105140 [compost metagenome]
MTSLISVAAKDFARERTKRVDRVVRYEARNAGAGAAEEVILLGHSPARCDLFWINLSIVLGSRDNVLGLGSAWIARIDRAIVFYY